MDEESAERSPLNGHGTTAVESYDEDIRAAATDPRALEDLYARARRMGGGGRFALALDVQHAASPENLLYAAWHYRLHGSETRDEAAGTARWPIAIVVSIVLSGALWLLSDPSLTFGRNVPWLVLLAGPLVAIAILEYLALAARTHLVRAEAVVLVLAAVTLGVFALDINAPTQPGNLPQIVVLSALHLPLLAWVALGVAVLGFRPAGHDVFGFLAKSLEVAATAGVAVIVGGMFVGLTVGLFSALGISLGESVARLLVLGGGGLIPVLTVAAIYDPTRPAGEQDFRRGLGRILPILARALLPLSLLVLLIYVGFIPFRFAEPFNNRDVLIVYNVLLFAIVGLLVAVIPVARSDAPARLAGLLRGGIVALAGLVALVSLYALAAILYRTAQDGATLNRVVVIGWNTVNIVILLRLLIGQARTRGEAWVDDLHATARLGAALYVAWGVFVALVVPLAVTR